MANVNEEFFLDDVASDFSSLYKDIISNELDDLIAEVNEELKKFEEAA